jgi:glutamate-1-semialdehyde 2,1-aminomutase
MAHLGAGLDSSGKKVKKAMCGGTMAATPISCCAGYTTLCEIEKRNACQVAGRAGDRLIKGIQESIKKYNLPFVAFNVGSVCHLDTVATMQHEIDWSKLWKVPSVLDETKVRQQEMEYMGAAYMAEGLVTLAGSRLYTSAAYTDEIVDDCIARFDRVLANCGKIDRPSK